MVGGVLFIAYNLPVHWNLNFQVSGKIKTNGPPKPFVFIFVFNFPSYTFSLFIVPAS